jgi:6-phosphogluconate dehydrogenase
MLEEVGGRQMQIALVGLGKMGGNMVRRLLRGGHEVIAYDRDAATVDALAKDGAVAATSLEDVIAKTKAPRAIWLMLPMAPLESTIASLSRALSPNDIVIDGGNSNPRDSQRRAALLAEKKIRWIDSGTSGGVWGLENGYCLMIGGDQSAYEHLLPILTTLAPKDGVAYFGKAGAGHFAKMVHNGIEYALMQSYAEGFELLAASEFDYDLHKLAHTWNQGGVVRSWLLELAERALSKNPKLDGLKPWVDDSGMGRWTVNEGVAHAVPVPTIAASLFARFASRNENSFALRLLSALRNEFGGHAVKKA